MSLRLSVRTKILSGFVLLFILFLSVLIYCLVQMEQVRWQLSIVQKGYLPLTRVMARLENSQQAMERTLDPERLLARDQTPGNPYPSLASFHLSRMEESIRQGANLVEQTRHMPGASLEERSMRLIQQQIRLIEQEQQLYTEVFRRLVGLLGENNAEGARKVLPNLRDQTLKLSRAIRDLSGMLDSRMEAAVVLTRERQERASAIVGALSAAAIAFGLVMLFVTHLVLRPISTLIQGVQRVAKGDYAQQVALEADDEIGTLAAEFNTMARSLLDRDASLRQSRQALEVAYHDMAHANRELKTLSLYNENILRSIEVGLLVCDREEKLTTLNPAARELWRLEPTHALGRPLGSLEGLSRLAERVRVVLEAGTLQRLEGLELVRLEQTRLLDCTFVPLIDGSSQVQGVIVLTEDVTERTRTRTRLMQSERLAVIGRMGAQVTHEIRNPLNALGLNAELLEDELATLDPGQGNDAWQLLRSMRKELDRLTEVTESYLRLARLPTPRLERLDVGQIVESLLLFVREELSSRHILLHFEGPGQPLEAMVDENQLRQALLNILRNASEALGAEGHIEVRLISTETGLRLSISDDGSGMDPGVLSHIFDPFYSTKVTGNGLGLPITQQIIEEHGGRITCESLAGQGTTFHIDLPLERGWS